MIDDTIAKIEARIRKANSVPEENKAELLSLFSTFKSEVAQLAQTHEEQAQSITGYSEVSAHEATREQKHPELLKHSLDGLSTSVTGFEESHPELVQIVNRICTTLSNLGI